MIVIPSVVQMRFQKYLREKAIPHNMYRIYMKWLRYYLDFCAKYQQPSKQKESLPAFILKLQQKHQSPAQQEQAARIIKLNHELCIMNCIRQDRKTTKQTEYNQFMP